MIYLLDIEWLKRGSHRATCKAFPEFAVVAVDRRHARRDAAVVLEQVITARMMQDRPLPKPATEGQIYRHTGQKVALSEPASQKCMLYMELKQSGLDRAELARRLNWSREAVDNLFRLDRLARMDHIEAAFSMLRRDVGKQVARRRRAEAAFAKVHTDE